MTTTNGSTTSASRTLVLACDVCEKPVTGKTGYICVDKDAAFEVRRRVDENQKELNARYPGRVATIVYSDQSAEAPRARHSKITPLRSPTYRGIRCEEVQTTIVSPLLNDVRHIAVPSPT